MIMINKSSLKNLLKEIVRHFLYCFPIQKDKIVFVNYKGKGYGDNPKYIAEEIQRQRLPWKMIWLVRGNVAGIPDCIKKVNLDGLKAYYELSTAKFLVSNSKNNIPTNYLTRKKKNQLYLQTWHGDFGPKYIEKEIEDTFSSGYIARSKIDSAATNAVLSGNEFFSTVLKESFWLPKECEILEYGIPRNDIYFRGDEERNRLKLQFGFSLDDHILLYAPTFRDDHDLSCYSINLERVRETLSKLDGGPSWKVIVRLHPNISSETELFDYNDYVVDGSSWADQQELCMISDVLVTDYSSIFADFLLMRKPVFLYVTDLEKYADKTKGRGLRDLFYHLPFAFCRDQQELEAGIESFEEKGYKEKVESYLLTYYRTFDDGHASEKVVNYLKEKQ